MLDSLLAKIFGTKNEREMKRLQPLAPSGTASSTSAQRPSSLNS